MSKNPWRGTPPSDDDNSVADPALDHTDILPPTSMIDGKYRLGRLLGEGGMGAVYEAEHTGLGVRVAVKLLNEMFTTDPSAVQRFRREARAAAAIRHPNIVEVTDTGTDEGGVPFIIMEYLEGESLSALLRRERVLTPGIASLIVSQILAGLAAAHDKGVIHRDLKPGNILLARKEDGSHQVKVLDFGISKFFSSTSSHDVTATGAVIGTPRFMAPEQARGQSDLDGRVDIYAVGVLFYRMVTGKLPFAARTQEEVIQLIVEGKVVPPREVRPELGVELERVILKAMAQDRERRYPDARSFFADLQQALPDVLAGGTLQLTQHTGATAGPTPFGHSGPIATRPILGVAPTSTEGPTAASLSASLSSLSSLADRSTRPASPQALRDQANTAADPPARRWARLLLPVLLVSVTGFVGWTFWPRGGGGTGDGQGGAGGGAGIGAAGAQYKGPALRFGITRYLPEMQLKVEHSSLVKYLAQRLRRRVELTVLDDYVDLSAQLANGDLELAALTSYAYVRAKRSWPKLRLLGTHTTSGSSSYEGYIVAKASAGIAGLKDLRGKVFCYVGPNSTSGYLYPRAVFRQHGMDPDKSFKATRFTGDHLGALRALESGACDGAAVFAGILFEAKRHGITPQAYSILATTPRIPYDAYCTSPKLGPQLGDALRDALLALKEGADLTRSVLGEKSRITGFAPAQDADYDPVRRIEQYIDQPTGKEKGKP